MKAGDLPEVWRKRLNASFGMRADRVHMDPAAYGARKTPAAPVFDLIASGDCRKVEAPVSLDVQLGVLTATIATFQTLGNWTPYVEITHPAWEERRWTF